jgi:ABC-2 type transport system ATP-binding protein
MLREVVQVKGLMRRYGKTVALHDVSFTLTGPQLCGILGPNGAGKTTLLDILEGLAVPQAGEVQLLGEPLRPGRYPRQRVGVVLQREFAPDYLSVGEYADLMAALQRVPDRAADIVRDAELQDRAHVAVSQLSGGEAQRLFIAAAVVHSPDLVFLDEPTGQLDPESKRRLGQSLRKLSRERTVVMTTHDLREAEVLCDSLLFMVGGRVRAFGTRQELLAAVPTAQSIEDTFFHFCGARVNEHGDLS